LSQIFAGWRVRVYLIQTREARHSGAEIRE
jgi:hypothetical protein